MGAVAREWAVKDEAAAVRKVMSGARQDAREHGGRRDMNDVGAIDNAELGAGRSGIIGRGTCHVVTCEALTGHLVIGHVETGRPRTGERPRRDQAAMRTRCSGAGARVSHVSAGSAWASAQMCWPVPLPISKAVPSAPASTLRTASQIAVTLRAAAGANSAPGGASSPACGGPQCGFDELSQVMLRCDFDRAMCRHELRQSHQTKRLPART